MFHARRRLAGYRLVASDTDWTAGHGNEVTGPIKALLLLVTGRRALLADLSGSGAAALQSAPAAVGDEPPLLSEDRADRRVVGREEGAELVDGGRRVTLCCPVAVVQGHRLSPGGELLDG
jgi:hypothetical protein